MLFQEFKQRYARPLFNFASWKLIGTCCRDAINCVLNYCNRTIDICSLIFSCSCEELCPSSAAPKKTVRLYFDTLKITPWLIMPSPLKITKLLDQCHIPLGGVGVQLHRYRHWSILMIGEEYGTWLRILRMPYLIIIFCTKLLFWDSLPLPCNGVGHHTLEVRCLNWAYFSWESHYIYFSLLLRYELLTPGVIPKGFMDGRKACQKMVCRFAGFTLFIKLPYFLEQFSIES